MTSTISNFSSFCFIALGLFTALPTVAEQPLTYSIEFSNFKYTNEVTSHYRQLLEDSLKRKVKYQRRRQGADLIVKHDITPISGYQRSTYFLDIIEPVVEITWPGHAKTSALDVQITARLSYVTGTQTYRVDSRDVATNMLLNGKAKRVIDVFSASSNYTSNNSEFEVTPLTKEAHVSVFFRDESMILDYENNLINAQSDRNPVKKVSEGTAQVNVFVLYKFYHPQKKEFNALEREIDALNWVNQQLEDINIVVQKSNMRTAFQYVTSTENTCVFNVRDNTERRSVSYYSKPVHSYLDIALYSKKGSNAQKKLEASGVDSQTDLKHILNIGPDFIIGHTPLTARIIPEEFKAYKNWMNIFSGQKTQGINYDYFKQVRMLQGQRLDFFIDYPMVMAEILRVDNIQPNFEAYSLRDFNAHVPGYMTCSRSKVGQGIVNALDKLLSVKEQRERFLDIQLSSYTEKQKQLVKDRVAEFYR